VTRLAAWRHIEAREGFEVVRIDGAVHAGSTAAVEAGDAWAVAYVIELARDGSTRRARVSGLDGAAVLLEADAPGRWRLDGERAPALDGLLDVDLESSALTNAFPVRRLALAVGGQADAPAAYVRALDLGVERLEQRYTRLPDGGQRYHYASPTFDFECELRYDGAGLVLDYPGIAVRVA
jgi:hypothetical protein